MPMRCPSTSFLTAALAAALSLPAWAGGPSAEHSAACIRDVEANRLLKAAEDAQQLLPATELAARQAACRSEGTRLLEEANPLERAFVMKAAQRRVDILKKPHTTG
jgi:hypothetical protein